MQEFTRWDLKKPAALGNVVLGTVEECKKHEEEGLIKFEFFIDSIPPV